MCQHNFKSETSALVYLLEQTSLEMSLHCKTEMKYNFTLTLKVDSIIPLFSNWKLDSSWQPLTDLKQLKLFSCIIKNHVLN